MALLARLSLLEPFETWPSMERAAEERFWDGLGLAVSDDSRSAGAIYLLGYVAEMVLKIAFFRVTGVTIHESLTVPLRRARTHAAWRGRNLHDLNGWVNLVLDERLLQGRPMNPVFAGQVVFHVVTVDANWNEVLRYKYSQAQEQELTAVFTSVNWLFMNRSALWS